MYNLISTITDLPKLVGCHDFPNSPQGMQLIKLISDFINEEYRYSGAQVTEAFKMAVKRELYLDGRRVDPSTFGQHLSVNVVGQVLTAYKEAKRDSNARPSGYNARQLPAHETKPITPAEAHDLILKWCKEDGELPEIAPYGTAYKYLFENGLVSEATDDKVDNRRALLLGKNYTISVNSKRQIAEKWYTKNVLS